VGVAGAQRVGKEILVLRILKMKKKKKKKNK